MTTCSRRNGSERRCNPRLQFSVYRSHHQLLDPRGKHAQVLALQLLEFLTKCFVVFICWWQPLPLIHLDIRPIENLYNLFLDDAVDDTADYLTQRSPLIATQDASYAQNSKDGTVISNQRPKGKTT